MLRSKRYLKFSFNSRKSGSSKNRNGRFGFQVYISRIFYDQESAIYWVSVLLTLCAFLWKEIGKTMLFLCWWKKLHFYNLNRLDAIKLNSGKVHPYTAKLIVNWAPLILITNYIHQQYTKDVEDIQYFEVPLGPLYGTLVGQKVFECTPIQRTGTNKLWIQLFSDYCCYT